jgi:hypothetical protein
VLIVMGFRRLERSFEIIRHVQITGIIDESKTSSNSGP